MQGKECYSLMKIGAKYSKGTLGFGNVIHKDWIERSMRRT
jgi:hypothetical protein